jgi:DNA-binding CsgD family transcriptional regulator
MIQLGAATSHDHARASLPGRIDQALVARRRTSKPSFAIVTGDPGHGRSTTLAAVADRIGQTGRVVVSLSGSSASQPIPFAGLLGARLHAPGLPDRPLHNELAPVLTTTSTPNPLGVAQHLDTVVATLVGSRSLVIVIDDLDLLDDTTRALLTYTAIEWRPDRYSLVASALTPPTVAHHSPIHFALDDLDYESAVGLAEQHLDPTDAHRLVSRVGGNPAALRHADAHRALSSDVLPLPRSLDDHVAHQIASLDDAARLTAEVFAHETKPLSDQAFEALIADQQLGHSVDAILDRLSCASLVTAHGGAVQWRRPWLAEGVRSRCTTTRSVRPHREPVASGSTTLLGRLSDAERRVVEVVITGASTRQAADRLFLGEKTVATHLQSSYRKLGVHSRTQLAALLLANR